MTGLEPEGEPLVLAYGKDNEPHEVRIVSEERYRRLQVYKHIREQQDFEPHPLLSGIGLTQRSTKESDLAIKYKLKELDEQAIEILPDKISDVPVIFEEEEYLGSHETYEGGDSIYADEVGTAGLFAHRGADDVLITAKHIAESSDVYSYDSNEQLGTHVDSSEDYDTGAYQVTTDNYEVRSTVWWLDDIIATWTFEGVSDTIANGDEIYANFYGHNSGFVEDTVAETHSEFVWEDCSAIPEEYTNKHQIEFEDWNTDQGDSGGPWVDNDGWLVAIHLGSGWSTGQRACDVDDDYRWSRGTSASEALDSVDANIY